MKLIGLSEAETIKSNAVIDYKTTKGVYGAILAVLNLAGNMDGCKSRIFGITRLHLAKISDTTI